MRGLQPGLDHQNRPARFLRDERAWFTCTLPSSGALLGAGRGCSSSRFREENPPCSGHIAFPRLPGRKTLPRHLATLFQVRWVRERRKIGQAPAVVEGAQTRWGGGVAWRGQALSISAVSTSEIRELQQGRQALGLFAAISPGLEQGWYTVGVQ